MKDIDVTDYHEEREERADWLLDYLRAGTIPSASVFDMECLAELVDSLRSRLSAAERSNRDLRDMVVRLQKLIIDGLDDDEFGTAVRSKVLRILAAPPTTKGTEGDG